MNLEELVQKDEWGMGRMPVYERLAVNVFKRYPACQQACERHGPETDNWPKAEREAFDIAMELAEDDYAEYIRHCL